MDSTYVSVKGSPDDVSGTGGLLTGLADDLGAKAAGILSTIENLEAAQPWGNDHFGSTFIHQGGYLTAPPGSSEPFNKLLKDELGKAGEGLSQIGLGVVNSMAGYAGTDLSSQQDINQVSI